MIEGFVGTFEGYVDMGSRTQLPKSLVETLEKRRKANGSDSIVLYSRESCDEGKIFLELSDQPFRDSSRDPQETPTDTRYRIKLPAYLAQKENGLTIIGAGDRIEIYNKDDWESLPKAEREMDEIRSKLFV